VLGAAVVAVGGCAVRGVPDTMVATGETTVTAVGRECAVDGVAFAKPTVSLTIGIGHYEGRSAKFSSPAPALGAKLVDELAQQLCSPIAGACTQNRVVSAPKEYLGDARSDKALAQFIDTPLEARRAAAASPNAATLMPPMAKTVTGGASSALGAVVTRAEILDRISKSIGAAQVRYRTQGEVLLLVYVSGQATLDEHQRPAVLATSWSAADTASLVRFEEILEPVYSFVRAGGNKGQRKQAMVVFDVRAGGADSVAVLRATPPPGVAIVDSAALGAADWSVDAYQARTPVQSTHYRMANPSPTSPRAAYESPGAAGGYEFTSYGELAQSVPVSAYSLASACGLARLMQAANRSTAAQQKGGRAKVRPIYAEQWVKQIEIELGRLRTSESAALSPAPGHGLAAQFGRPFGGPIFRTNPSL
jgi:hypothetical protein